MCAFLEFKSIISCFVQATPTPDHTLNFEQNIGCYPFVLIFINLILNVLVSKWPQVKKVLATKFYSKYYNFSIGRVSIQRHLKKLRILKDENLKRIFGLNNSNKKYSTTKFETSLCSTTMIYKVYLYLASFEKVMIFFLWGIFLEAGDITNCVWKSFCSHGWLVFLAVPKSASISRGGP